MKEKFIEIMKGAKSLRFRYVYQHLPPAVTFAVAAGQVALESALRRRKTASSSKVQFKVQILLFESPVSSL